MAEILRDPTLERAQRREIRDRKCASCKHGVGKRMFGRVMYWCGIGTSFPKCMQHEGTARGFILDDEKFANEIWTHNCPTGGRIAIACGYPCEKCGMEEGDEWRKR